MSKVIRLRAVKSFQNLSALQRTSVICILFFVFLNIYIINSNHQSVLDYFLSVK